MSTRRTPLVAAFCVALVLLALPAVASAHHIDNNHSRAACVLVNNVPTLTVDVVFVDFEPRNKPVHWSISINDTFDSADDEGWPDTENPHTQHWTKTAVAANTSYSIVYSAHWGRGYEARIPFETVVCPQPVPPAIRYGCNGQPIPPGAPVCAPPAPPVVKPRPKSPPKSPPKTPCVKAPASHFRLIDTPPMSSIDHGLVTFTVRGPHIRWVRFHVDHRWALTDRSRPFKAALLLWRTDIWGPALWGRHTVRATVRTRCGTVHLVKRVFNNDPPA
jgi:hypothetical protein